MASVGIISNYIEIPKNIIKIDSLKHHDNFIKEWREILQRFNTVRDNILICNNKDDIQKSISDIIYDLAELIHFNSSLVNAKVSTFGTSKKSHDHYMVHLENEIFTKKGISIVGNDINNSLKLAELIYSDDAIVRFLPELIIKPKNPHEKEISIIGSPKEIMGWVYEVDKLYLLFLKGKNIKKDEFNKTIEKLNTEKNKVIKTAIEMKMYLPISPRNIISDDRENLYSKITKEWSRNKKIHPDVIFNYLYLNEVDKFKEFGLIND